MRVGLEEQKSRAYLFLVVPLFPRRPIVLGYLVKSAQKIFVHTVFCAAVAMHNPERLCSKTLLYMLCRQKMYRCYFHGDLTHVDVGPGQVEIPDLYRDRCDPSGADRTPNYSKRTK